jgi:hypothetical protein
VPLSLQSRGVIVYRPADLIEHVLQLRGLRERTLPRLMPRVLPRQLMSSHINMVPRLSIYFLIQQPA